MNDLEMIKELRRSEPGITAEVAAAARVRLRHEWTAAPARRRPWTASRAVRAGLAGAIALTLAAGITVAQGVGSRPGGVVPGASVANAAALGERAARAAEAEPYVKPRPDQWIHTRSRGAPMKDVNNWRVGVDTTAMREEDVWRRVDGTALAYVVGGKVQIQRTSGGPIPEGADPAKGEIKHSLPYDPLGDVDTVPTDPTALLDRLYKAYYRNRDPVGDETPGEGVFDMVDGLLAEPLPPRLRAALFRALPRVPGVTARGDAVDAAGRHGVAFVNTFQGWHRRMIILDATTYRYLGSTSTAVQDHVLDRNEGTIKKGTITALDALLTQHIVDHPGQTPASQPR